MAATTRVAHVLPVFSIPFGECTPTSPATIMARVRALCNDLPEFDRSRDAMMNIHGGRDLVDVVARKLEDAVRGVRVDPTAQSERAADVVEAAVRLSAAAARFAIDVQRIMRDRYQERVDAELTEDEEQEADVRRIMQELYQKCPSASRQQVRAS